MLDMLAKWEGRICVGDNAYTDYEELKASNLSSNVVKAGTHIKLYPSHVKANTSENTKSQSIDTVSNSTEYEITVKQYMTKKSSPEFDFMAKWNNNKPMPMRTMVGTVEKETRGMVYMKLHGLAKPTINCYCCGKELTNPISRKYGVGPICLSKMGITRDIEDVEAITEDLVNTQWEGWVIRSAITDKKQL